MKSTRRLTAVDRVADHGFHRLHLLSQKPDPTGDDVTYQTVVARPDEEPGEKARDSELRMDGGRFVTAERGDEGRKRRPGEQAEPNHQDGEIPEHPPRESGHVAPGRAP